MVWTLEALRTIGEDRKIKNILLFSHPHTAVFCRECSGSENNSDVGQHPQMDGNVCFDNLGMRVLSRLAQMHHL